MEYQQLHRLSVTVLHVAGGYPNHIPSWFFPRFSLAGRGGVAAKQGFTTKQGQVRGGDEVAGSLARPMILCVLFLLLTSLGLVFSAYTGRGMRCGSPVRAGRERFGKIIEQRPQ